MIAAVIETYVLNIYSKFINSITIPIGNTQSLGGYQECLSVVHHEFVDSNTTFNIIGQ